MSVPKFGLGDLGHTGMNIDLVLPKKKNTVIGCKVYIWQNFVLSTIVENLIILWTKVEYNYGLKKN